MEAHLNLKLLMRPIKVSIIRGVKWGCLRFTGLHSFRYSLQWMNKRTMEETQEGKVKILAWLAS